MYTDYRPTPLQHFMFPSGGDGLYLIVDERSTFREDNFQKAIAALTSSAADGGACLWCYSACQICKESAGTSCHQHMSGFEYDMHAVLGIV